MPFYAVAKGVVPGIYTEWSECQKQINGFKQPQYKKFSTKEEAEEFIAKKKDGTVDNRKKVSSTSKDEENGTKKDKSSSEGSDSGDSSRKRSRSPEGESPTKKKKLDADVEKGLTRDSEGRVEIFTDGCYHMHGSKCKAGVGAYFGKDSHLNISEPVVGVATKNVAELQAITKTLELVKSLGIEEIVVKTDHQFTINCAANWMDGWRKRGWKKADGTEISNKADIMDLDKAQEGLCVSYVMVKGAGNDEAGKLAKEGGLRYEAPKSED